MAKEIKDKQAEIDQIKEKDLKTKNPIPIIVTKAKEANPNSVSLLDSSASEDIYIISKEEQQSIQDSEIVHK